MEITERLRNTPTGLIVLVGDMRIVVEKYRPYYNGQNKIPCRDASSGAMELGIASTHLLAWPIRGRITRAWCSLKRMFDHSS